MTEQDLQERKATRETINKIFDKVDANNKCFHSLDKKVGILQSDVTHMKEQGCPVLNKQIEQVEDKIIIVDKRHTANYNQVDKWIGGGKVFLWVISSLGGLAFFLKWLLLKKGG